MRALGILLAVISCSMPSPTRAQALVDDIAAYPIRAITVFLTTGTNYEFRTTGLMAGPAVPGAPLTVADTILSLRNTPTSATPSNALGGADGCLPVGGGTFSWEPSCFSYVANYTGNHTLYLYAYNETTYGTATVQSRVLPSGGWTTYGTGYSFGGSRAPLNAASGAGRARFETTYRPGNVSHHVILVARASQEWNTRYAGNANSGRIAGNAQFDADLTSTGFAPGDWWVYFGALFAGQTGDTRVVRNDYFTSGADLDQDGLSFALESDETGGPRVGSCDRPSQTLSNGFSCRNVGARTHPECVVTGDNIAGDAECADSLRDTDHDGLRDDLELYGANDPLLRLPRYGADPARMDVFVELDASDQITTTPDVCDGFHLNATPTRGSLPLIGDASYTDPVSPRDFILGMNAVWANAPSWINPNGSPGIAVHYDVGLTPPNPRETRWGSWGGGGSCAPPSCSYGEAYNGVSCDAFDIPPPAVPLPAIAYISNSRKWVFHYGLDFPAGSGTGDLHGMAFFATTMGGHIHELGHNARLDHEGPLGTASATVTCMGFGESWLATNYRPQFLSRMNYFYTYVGGLEGNNATLFDAFSFSPGVLATAHPSTGMSTALAPEICPFPGRTVADLAALAAGQDGTGDDVHVAPGAGGCANVNWNGSLDAGGNDTYSGTTHVATREFLRLERRRFLEPTVSTTITTHDVGPNAAAIVNGVLLFAYRRCAVGGSCEGRLRGDSTADCSLYPTDPDSAGFSTSVGAYPACFGHGDFYSLNSSLLDPRAVALVGYRNDGTTGTEDRVLEVVTNSAGTMVFYRFNPVPSSVDSHEFLNPPTTFVSTGLTASTTSSLRDLTLVRLPGTNDVLVMYPAVGGALRQFVIDPDAGTFGSDGVAVDLAGAALPLGTTAASMANVDGVVFMTRVRANQIDLYRMAAATRRWELMQALPSGTPNSTPTLAIAQNFELGGSRVHVFFRTFNGLYYHRAPATPSWFSSTAGWSLTQPVANVADEAAPTGIGTAAAVWDSRSTLATGTAGLRLYRVYGRGSVALGLFSTGIDLSPFAHGADPTVGIDHNEWDGLQFGICRGPEQASGFAPAPSIYNPTSYADFMRCGDYPNYAVPTATGVIMSSRGNGHRAAHPELYGPVSCP